MSGAVTTAGDSARGSTVSGPQRPRTATTAWRDVSEPQRRAPLRQRAARRQRAATSASRNVRAARRQQAVTSSTQRQARNVKRATSSAQRQGRNVGAALRQSAETSAGRKAGLRCRWRRTRPFSRNDGTRHRQFKI